MLYIQPLSTQNLTMWDPLTHLIQIRKIDHTSKHIFLFIRVQHKYRTVTRAFSLWADLFMSGTHYCPWIHHLIWFCHRDTHLTFSVAWWDFVHVVRTACYRAAGERLRSGITVTKFIRRVKMCHRKPTTTHGTGSIISLISGGPLLLYSSVSHECPGASVWEPVWRLWR